MENNKIDHIYKMVEGALAEAKPRLETEKFDRLQKYLPIISQVLVTMESILQMDALINVALEGQTLLKDTMNEDLDVLQPSEGYRPPPEISSARILDRFDIDELIAMMDDSDLLIEGFGPEIVRGLADATLEVMQQVAFESIYRELDELEESWSTEKLAEAIRKAETFEYPPMIKLVPKLVSNPDSTSLLVILRDTSLSLECRAAVLLVLRSWGYDRAVSPNLDMAAKDLDDEIRRRSVIFGVL